MTAIRKQAVLSVEEYLEQELVSTVKHEYLGGHVYAMAGARNKHNIIAGNAFGALHSLLKGKKCRPYNSDTKIRIRERKSFRFYYPDFSVVCDHNPPKDSFLEAPVVIGEVISESSRRKDEYEKLTAYCSIPSLQAYMLIESDSPYVLVLRRCVDGFERVEYDGLKTVIPLPEIGTELTLDDIYQEIAFESDDQA